MSKPTVIDIFCGAGGFSEGFRQQGFEIKMGIDNWDAAITTFNHNFGLKCEKKDVFELENSVQKIEALPDTDVILGSPPCVSFSSSNKSGNTDKSLGIRLTEIFLRIVTVKKWKRDSILKAWFMENVPNSKAFLNKQYTFKELGLKEWATENNLSSTDVAINLEGNNLIVNSADYGTPQARRRVISGEIISINELSIPPISHRPPKEDSNLPTHIALKVIRQKLPSPYDFHPNLNFSDSLYPKIKDITLTDHFYDTGLYQCEWKHSKYLKTNHPYMGRMSFPENEEKPSRTITATNIGNSREAIIYRSELKRRGNGQYRNPTVRESACIMGFPLTFQFIGSQGVKSRMVGNAVCPPVSRAFAKLLRKEMGLRSINSPIVKSNPDLDSVNDLNNFSTKKFNLPPQKKKESRFRRHPFKDGNMTVTLSNYDIHKNNKKQNKWITSVQYGSGKGFPTYNFPNEFYKSIEKIIHQTKKGREFLSIVSNGFVKKIGNGYLLQEMYETQRSKDGFLEPIYLIERIGRIIEQLDISDESYSQGRNKLFKDKSEVPLKQLYALYAINKVSSIANEVSSAR